MESNMFGKSKSNAADKEPLLAEEQLEMPTGILKLQQVEGSAKEPSLDEEEKEELETPGILKLQQVEGSAKEPSLAEEEELEMPGILKLQQVEGSAKDEEEELEMPGILKLQQVEGSAVAVAYSAPTPAPEAISSISSGLSFVGKIVGNGRLAIFGHVEGEVHASTVQIGEGAQVEGNIVAEELTIGGRVKGMIHANRVRLNSTAVVEGYLYYQSLAIDENAQFEGMSRRQKNVIDTPSHVPEKLPQAQAESNDGNRKGNGASDSLDP
jgi:cytoskeletal protein CcmA (bactofilin family)